MAGDLKMHFTHIAQSRYFRHTWPRLDTRKWPGREVYWVWRHPLLAITLIPGGLFVDGLAVYDLVTKVLA